MERTSDEEADRLMTLLDTALDSVRKGDGDSAILALKEGVETAERLPKKDDAIALHDLSNENEK